MASFKSPMFKLAFGLSVPLAIMPGLSILMTQPAGLANGLPPQLVAQDFDPGKVGAPGRGEKLGHPVAPVLIVQRVPNV